MTVAAVINPGAGGVSDEEGRERLRALVRSVGDLIPPEWRRVVSGSEVAREAEELIHRGATVIFAGGGDGTVSTVAGLVASTDVALGVLPLGTRNHFARDIGMPLDMEQWHDILEQLPRRSIDLGYLNDVSFINNASIGLYPRIVEERDRAARNSIWSKRTTQISAAIRVAIRFPRSRCVLQFSGRRVTRATPIIFVGNNAYEGGLMTLAKRPKLDSGQLWVCTARASGPLHLLRLFWHVARGHLGDIDELETALESAFEIEFKRKRVTVAVDGETRRVNTPLHFRSAAKALQVIAP